MNRRDFFKSLAALGGAVALPIDLPEFPITEEKPQVNEAEEVELPGESVGYIDTYIPNGSMIVNYNISAGEYIVPGQLVELDGDGNAKAVVSGSNESIIMGGVLSVDNKKQTCDVLVRKTMTFSEEMFTTGESIGPIGYAISSTEFYIT